MSAKQKPEKATVGTADTAVITTNGNDQKHAVRSKPSNFGQFGYTVSAELTLEQLKDRSSEGLLHIAQRAPASRVEKLLVGYTKREEMGEDWTRDMIAYSDDLARKFETELAKEIAKVAHIAVKVEAEKYEVTEREPAYAEAKKIFKAAAKHGKAVVDKLAKNVGYTGNDRTIDSVEFLQAIENDRQARNAAMFA